MNFEDVRVIRSDRKSFCLEISPRSEVILRVPKRAGEDSIRAFFDGKSKWLEKHLAMIKERGRDVPLGKDLTDKEMRELKAEAKDFIAQRVKHFAEVMGTAYKSVSIRCQKTRWGSCSAKKNLSFNCLLLLLPSELLDYVVVHELCHLKHMNHSQAFWSEVEKFLPDYKKRRALLKKCKI